MNTIDTADTVAATPSKPQIPSVRISGRYDDRDIPFVRLTRSVQTGFGIGIGIWLAMLAMSIPTALILMVFSVSLFD